MKDEDVRAGLKKLSRALSGFVEVFCVILLATLVITVSVSVFTRFVIFHPLNFADPLAKYLMMWMAFLGVGLAIREDAHIRVDMFVSGLRGKSRRWLTIIVSTLVSIFLIAIVYYGFRNAISARDSRDPFVFGISMMVPYLSVPVGALYALVQLNLSLGILLLREEGANERRELR